jgi:hypothetical protein
MDAIDSADLATVTGAKADTAKLLHDIALRNDCGYTAWRQSLREDAAKGRKVHWLHPHFDTWIANPPPKVF